MCGITGVYYFDANRRVERERLLQMTYALHHRGPDGHGILRSKNVGFGHTRLSIIDTSTSAFQPMSSLDENYWITFNGEIYNYKELRDNLENVGTKFKTNGDTEVLLNLYIKHGEECLDHLEGMFSFAIYDLRKNLLFVSRDRLGIKPLYFYRDSEKFLFASELKSILAFGDLKLDLNPMAVYNFLEFMNVPVPETIYSQIHKLEPANYLKISQNSIEKRNYWSFVPTNKENLLQNFDETKDNLTAHLNRVTKSHLVSDVPVGAFLSGGVDSSTIVAFASKLAVFNNAPLETFSITFKNEGAYDESSYAKKVSDQFKTHHNEFNIEANFADSILPILKMCDEPFAVSSAFALYFLSKETSKKTKVVLTGDGSDEIFAGYPRHFQKQKLELVAQCIPSFLKKHLNLATKHLNTNHGLSRKFRNILEHGFFDPALFYHYQLCSFKPTDLNSVLSDDFYQTNLNKSLNFESLMPTLENYLLASQSDEINQKLFTEVKTTLVDEMLTKVDRMTMAFGLEARVPFLDHKLVEFAFQIPGKFKVKDHEGKYILKKAMEPFIERNILYRPKWGFNVPLSSWLKSTSQNQVRTLLEGTLFSGKKSSSGFFNHKTVASLYKDHKQGLADNSNKLFQILNFELWYKNIRNNKMAYLASSPLHVDIEI